MTTNGKSAQKPDPLDIRRVPALKPITPMERAAIAMLADGHDDAESARLLGCGIATYRTHLLRAAAKIPGDLIFRSRMVAWFRGASADILGVDHVVPPRQESLTRGYAISGRQACPYCANVSAHGHPTERQKQHERPA